MRFVGLTYNSLNLKFMHAGVLLFFLSKQWVRIALKQCCKRGSDYVCGPCEVTKIEVTVEKVQKFLEPMDAYAASRNT